MDIMHKLKPFVYAVYMYLLFSSFMAYLLTMFWYETNQTLQFCLPIIVELCKQALQTKRLYRHIYRLRLYIIVGTIPQTDLNAVHLLLGHTFSNMHKMRCGRAAAVYLYSCVCDLDFRMTSKITASVFVDSFFDTSWRGQCSDTPQGGWGFYTSHIPVPTSIRGHHRLTRVVRTPLLWTKGRHCLTRVEYCRICIKTNHARRLLFLVTIMYYILYSVGFEKEFRRKPFNYNLLLQVGLLNNM